MKCSPLSKGVVALVYTAVPPDTLSAQKKIIKLANPLYLLVCSRGTG